MINLADYSYAIWIEFCHAIDKAREHRLFPVLLAGQSEFVRERVLDFVLPVHIAQQIREDLPRANASPEDVAQLTQLFQNTYPHGLQKSFLEKNESVEQQRYVTISHEFTASDDEKNLTNTRDLLCFMADRVREFTLFDLDRFLEPDALQEPCFISILIELLTGYPEPESAGSAIRNANRELLYVALVREGIEMMKGGNHGSHIRVALKGITGQSDVE
jgi:hypothetical protein